MTGKRRDNPLDLEAVREQQDSEQRRSERRTLGSRLDFFEVAELAEMALADIFTLASRRLKDDPDLRALFALAASEEQAHARRLVEAAALWKQARGGAPIPLDRAAIRDALAETQETFDGLENSERFDEPRVTKRAIALGFELDTVYWRALEQASDPILSELFSDLLMHGQGYTALIERSRQAPGDDEQA